MTLRHTLHPGLPDMLVWALPAVRTDVEAAYRA
jgi:hypothetical protein